MKHSFTINSKAKDFYNIDSKNLSSSIEKLSLKAKKSHKNIYGQTTYSRINIEKYDFENEELCKQAKDILINCFPRSCSKIKKGEEIGIKIVPSIFLLGKKSIIVAKIPCEQVDEKWENFKNTLIETYKEPKTEIIVSKCGKVIWK
ncbi:hypothetical protein [Aureivirga sp. CE67]|uniref:hypothetical protein n=1 Tax=Aureivirga sp. CE67 TaxID=1788983 RepID=UPI0018CA1ADE|nr:hypothetical protein [Aureivirga sp. CE67]